MKMFWKAVLTLAACMIIGSAISAAAHVTPPPAYYYPPPYSYYYVSPYYAPLYYDPVFVSESHGYVKEKMTRFFGELSPPVPAAYTSHPAITRVQYGIQTYPVYDYINMHVQGFRPGPVILPTYWRQVIR